MSREPLGKVLRDEGLVGEDELRSALVHQSKWGCRIGEALRQLRLIEDGKLLDVLGRQLGVAPLHIGDRTIPPEVLQRLPCELVVRHRVLPVELVKVRGQVRLRVASTTPDDLRVLDEVAFAAGVAVEPVLAAEDDLDNAISRHYGFLRRDAIDVPFSLDAEDEEAEPEIPPAPEPDGWQQAG